MVHVVWPTDFQTNMKTNHGISTRSGYGKPNRRKWGSRTFGEGVRNWLQNPLLLVNRIPNPEKGTSGTKSALLLEPHFLRFGLPELLLIQRIKLSGTDLFLGKQESDCMCQEKRFFRRFFFLLQKWRLQKCTPFLAMVLWVPKVLLGPISLGIFLWAWVTLDFTETPFAKTPFPCSFPWFLNIACVVILFDFRALLHDEKLQAILLKASFDKRVRIDLPVPLPVPTPPPTLLTALPYFPSFPQETHPTPPSWTRTPPPSWTPTQTQTPPPRTPIGTRTLATISGKNYPLVSARLLHEMFNFLVLGRMWCRHLHSILANNQVIWHGPFLGRPVSVQCKSQQDQHGDSVWKSDFVA